MLKTFLTFYILFFSLQSFSSMEICGGGASADSQKEVLPEDNTTHEEAIARLLKILRKFYPQTCKQSECLEEDFFPKQFFVSGEDLTLYSNYFLKASEKYIDLIKDRYSSMLDGNEELKKVLQKMEEELVNLKDQSEAKVLAQSCKILPAFGLMMRILYLADQCVKSFSRELLDERVNLQGEIQALLYLLSGEAFPYGGSDVTRKSICDSESTSFPWQVSTEPCRHRTFQQSGGEASTRPVEPLPGYALPLRSPCGSPAEPLLPCRFRNQRLPADLQ